MPDRTGPPDRRDQLAVLEERVRTIELDTTLHDGIAKLSGAVEVLKTKIEPLIQAVGKEPPGVSRMITLNKWIGGGVIAVLILMAVVIVLAFDVRGDMKVVYPMAIAAREMAQMNTVANEKLRDMFIEERTLNRIFRETAEKAATKK